MAVAALCNPGWHGASDFIGEYGERGCAARSIGSECAPLEAQVAGLHGLYPQYFQKVCLPAKHRPAGIRHDVMSFGSQPIERRLFAPGRCSGAYRLSKRIVSVDSSTAGFERPLALADAGLMLKIDALVDIQL